MNDRQDTQSASQDGGQRHRGPVARILPWLIWAGLLIVWTYGLLSPAAPHLASAALPAGTSFYVSKAAHVGVYAFLACLVCWLTPRWSVRLAFWLGLVVHGALTEYLQQFVEGRTGQLSDVGLDALGVVLGVAVGLAVERLRERA